MNNFRIQGAGNQRLILFLVCFVMSACSQAQTMGSKIVVKIPFNEQLKMYAYTGEKKTSAGGEQLNWDKAKAWSQKKLSNVMSYKKDNNITTGKGTFNFTEKLKVVGNIEHDFTVEFSCKIIPKNNQYQYDISYIEIV